MVKRKNEANKENIFDVFGGQGSLEEIEPRVPLADVTDEIANKRGFFIDFYHLPTGRNVRFKSYITGFTDGYKSEWQKENVFGRMDPAMTFKNTERVINIQWKIISDSEDEALNNYARLSELLRYLYPSYQAVRDAQTNQRSSASTINSPPLFRVKFLNWITKVPKKDEQLEEDAKEFGTERLFALQDAFNAGNAKDGGLIAAIDGFTKTPNMEAGVFDLEDGIYAKVIDIQANLIVLHENELGWDTNGNPLPGFGDFPYGLNAGIKRANFIRGRNTSEEENAQTRQQREDGAVRRNARKQSARTFR